MWCAVARRARGHHSNETLLTQTVFNHTRSDRKVRLVTALQVDYGADVERAMQILREVAVRHPRVLKDPLPQRCW